MPFRIRSILRNPSAQSLPPVQNLGSFPMAEKSSTALVADPIELDFSRINNTSEVVDVVRPRRVSAPAEFRKREDPVVYGEAIAGAPQSVLSQSPIDGLSVQSNRLVHFAADSPEEQRSHDVLGLSHSEETLAASQPPSGGLPAPDTQQLTLTTVHYQPYPIIEDLASWDECLSPELSSRPSPTCLSARLSLLVMNLGVHIDIKQRVSGQLIHKDLAIIMALSSLGWTVKPLALNPPSASYHILEEHTFWLVQPPASLFQLQVNEDDESFPEDAYRFIIDFHFADLFIVARPTSGYEQFLANIRKDFVGTLSEIQQAIRVFSAWAQLSLLDQAIDLPPWRRPEFLEACFSQAVVSYWTQQDEPSTELARELLGYIPKVRDLLDFGADHPSQYATQAVDGDKEATGADFEKVASVHSADGDGSVSGISLLLLNSSFASD